MKNEEKKFSYICPNCMTEHTSVIRWDYSIGKFYETYEIDLESEDQSNFEVEVDEIDDTLDEGFICPSCKKELPAEIVDEIRDMV
jgi:hypothetical protein